jgi:hypothetical protein
MFSGTGATNTLGSVPVHTYGGGGEVMDSRDAQNGGNNGNGPGNGGTPGLPPRGGVPNETPPYSIQGPNSNLYEKLLGKNPGQMGPQPTGPEMGPMAPPAQGNP